MKKFLLFPILVFMTAVIAPSCSDDEEEIITPPTTSDSIIGGDNIGGDSISGGDDSINGGDDDIIDGDSINGDGDDIINGDSISGGDDIIDGDSISGGDSIIDGDSIIGDGDDIIDGDSISGDDEISYSEMKEREKKAINEFIRSKSINVISFKEFIENDSVTDVENNEYVEIDGVYMQIVRNPKGVEGARKMYDGERLNIIARFFEYNILKGDTICGNIYDSDNPDYLRVQLSHGFYSAVFTSGYMYSIYGGAVPTGWMTPLPYLYLTRKSSQYAKVKLIVPHTKGTSNASSYVYPCFYEITFIPERLYDIN